MYMISRSTLLGVRNVSHTQLVDKIKTNISCSLTFFRKSCPLWDIAKKCATTGQPTDDKMWHTRFAFWITKAADTHWQNVKIITFLRQQWLRERASMLSYMYTACLVSVTTTCHSHTVPNSTLRLTDTWMTESNLLIEAVLRMY